MIEFYPFQTASRYDGPSVPRMSGHQIHEPFDEVARECVRSLSVSFFKGYPQRNILRILHRFLFFVLCFFLVLKDSLDDGFIKCFRNFCNFIYYSLIYLKCWWPQPFYIKTLWPSTLINILNDKRCARTRIFGSAKNEFTNFAKEFNLFWLILQMVQYLWSTLFLLLSVIFSPFFSLLSILFFLHLSPQVRELCRSYVCARVRRLSTMWCSTSPRQLPSTNVRGFFRREGDENKEENPQRVSETPVD